MYTPGMLSAAAHVSLALTGLTHVHDASPEILARRR